MWGAPPQGLVRIGLGGGAAPPATIVLDNIVAEFRRSLAAVVHQDRHHAVVLTELFPDTLLDPSPGIVIELNVC